MAKRFTATEKWDDGWFSSLTKDEMLFWMYLCDRCNHAGIWDVNTSLLQFHTHGIEFNLDKFHNRVIRISETKWFLPGFIRFQYGDLNPDNKAHFSVITQLKLHGLWPLKKECGMQGATKGHGSPLVGAKDKDKDKVKDKDNYRSTKEVPSNLFGEPQPDKKKFSKPTLEEIRDFCVASELVLNQHAFFDYYESKGWRVGNAPMKNWQAAARNWARREVERQNPTQGEESWRIPILPAKKNQLI